MDPIMLPAIPNIIAPIEAAVAPATPRSALQDRAALLEGPATSATPDRVRQR